MKKPVLAVLGVAGACAACCAIPLAIPLFGGAAALGLMSWLAAALPISLDLAIFMVVLSIAALVWGARVWAQRRRAKACGMEEPVSAPACAVGPGATGCGCAPR